MTSNQHEADVKRNMADGRKAGVSGTPAFFINGVMLSGALPIERFKTEIDRALKDQSPARCPPCSTHMPDVSSDSRGPAPRRAAPPSPRRISSRHHHPHVAAVRGRCSGSGLQDRVKTLLLAVRNAGPASLSTLLVTSPAARPGAQLQRLQAICHIYLGSDADRGSASLLARRSFRRAGALSDLWEQRTPASSS